MEIDIKPNGIDGNVVAVLASAFFDGQAAYRKGKKVGDNPFNETDEQHWRWMQGWTMAAFEKIKNRDEYLKGL